MILGIDPGLEGAFVLTDGLSLKWWAMPTQKVGKNNEVIFDKVHELLHDKIMPLRPRVFIERAMPMAMGSKHAFNYGRGFAALEIALALVQLETTYIEPQKWTKEMHEGISADLRPKAKSLIAVKRLYPKLVRHLPIKKNGNLHDGPVDALLIAGYGLRKMRASVDFF